MKRMMMKKVLSGIVVTAYLMLYTAPVGLCLTSVPTTTVTAGINKPVLRSASTPSTLKLEGDICISKKNPKVSLSLRNSDVQQVLRMFADKAGLNIIFHSSVPQTSASLPSSFGITSTTSSSSSSSGTGPSSTVTMDLVNVPLNEAFKMVMQVTGLTYFIENNTIIVASADAAKTLNLAKEELASIPVKFVDASILADFLNKNVFSLNRPGLSNANIAITNPETNEILIFGTKNDYLMAKKIVAQLDIKPVEETFVVNHTTPKEMADLLCKTLFPNSSGSGSSGSSKTGGAAPIGNIGGIMTGGAADSSSSSSSSSGSGGDLALGTGVVACQYSNSVSADTLTSLKTNNLIITYFPQKGSILARGGSAQQMEMIREFISKHDKKQPQAYLELSVIELNETGSKAFNNTWNVWSEFFSGTFDGKTYTNPLYPNFFGDTSYSVVDSTNTTNPTKVLYTLSKFTGTPMVTYTMNYLVKTGRGRVLANPRILITNGQTSKINLTTDYIASVTATTTTTTTTPVTTFTYNIASDDGVQVSLTPYISPEGYVTMNITPKYATIAEKVPGVGLTAGLTVATLLNKRDLDLKNIRIKDGETLVIGGMIREGETKTVAKIPILGDLPGVGMFFRNTSSDREREELVIMLTPKIIKDSEDLVNKPVDNAL